MIRSDRGYDEMKKELLDEVEKSFRPEFLNRLDEIIVFQSLDRDDLRQIIDIEMAHVQDRLRSQGIEVELTNGAKDFLIEIGYNPEYGARPLRRTRGGASVALGPQGPASSGWIVRVPRTDRGRQDPARQGSREVHVR